MSRPGAERREAIAARIRAETRLRAARALGQPIAWAGKPMFYRGWPILRADGTIDLGRNCRLWGGPVRLQLAAREGAEIVFGEGVGVNFGAEITAAVGVVVGDFTRLGPNVTIYDTNFHPLGEGEAVRSGPVTIGDNAWLCRSALVLPGVTIGDHAVVAAHSVVVHDVPARAIVAGNPARVVGDVRAADEWRRD